MELEKHAGVAMSEARRVIGRVVVSEPECLDLGRPDFELIRLDQHVDVGHGPCRGVWIERACERGTLEKTERAVGAFGSGGQRFDVMQANDRLRELDVEASFQSRRDEGGRLDRRAFQSLMKKRPEPMVPGARHNELPVNRGVGRGRLGADHEVTDHGELCFIQLAHVTASFRGRTAR